MSATNAEGRHVRIVSTHREIVRSGLTGDVWTYSPAFVYQDAEMRVSGMRVRGVGGVRGTLRGFDTAGCPVVTWDRS